MKDQSQPKGALAEGKVFLSISDGEFKVLQDMGWKKVRVRFLFSGYEQTATRSQIKKGQLKDRFKPVLYGVGYIGGTKYKSKLGRLSNPVYDRWKNMLARCYDQKTQARAPSYVGCTVCEDWHNFQSYAEWFSKNCSADLEVDKDILIDGNRVYSPSACLGVTHQENTEKALAKTYIVTSPEGNANTVYNLTKFCDENGLLSSLMRKVLNGSRSHHRGWRVAYAY